MGGSASSPEARVSREYRRREAERGRRIMDPEEYGSPDELPETEYTRMGAVVPRSRRGKWAIFLAAVAALACVGRGRVVP